MNPKFKKALRINLVIIGACILLGPFAAETGAIFIFAYAIFTIFMTVCLLAMLLLTRNKEYYGPYLLAELAASTVVIIWIALFFHYSQLH